MSLAARNPVLVYSILGHLEGNADDPPTWNEIVDTFTTAATGYKSVENTLYDLITFGAVHHKGRRPAPRSIDRRTLVITPLGAAWLEQRIEPPLKLRTPKEPQ